MRLHNVGFYVKYQIDYCLPINPINYSKNTAIYEGGADIEIKNNHHSFFLLIS